MERTERFRSLEEVRLHRDRLRALRDGHLAGIKGHWESLGEPEFRSGVVNGVFHSVWEAWRPLDALRTVATDGDLPGTALGLLLGRHSKSPWGRALVWAAGAVLPIIVSQVRNNEHVQRFTSELGRSWERIKDHMRERREARRERRHSDTDE
jgi:hypothetical protein